MQREVTGESIRQVALVGSGGDNSHIVDADSGVETRDKGIIDDEAILVASERRERDGPGLAELAVIVLHNAHSEPREVRLKSRPHLCCGAANGNGLRGPALVRDLERAAESGRALSNDCLHVGVAFGARAFDLEAVNLHIHVALEETSACGAGVSHAAAASTLVLQRRPLSLREVTPKVNFVVILETDRARAEKLDSGLVYVGQRLERHLKRVAGRCQGRAGSSAVRVVVDAASGGLAV